MTQRLNTSASEGGISTHSRGLTVQRREKLVNLKQREDLKDALIEKFKSRFGTGARYRGPDEVSVCSETIRREVDNFAQKALVTENNLARLERRLQVRATQPQRGDAASVSGVSAYSGATTRSRSLASLGENVVGVKSTGEPMSYDWSRLDEYASYLHEQDAIRQKLGVTALQRKFKLDLDQQVQEKGLRKNEWNEEDKRYHQNQMVELERWKATEQLRAEELKQKLMKEKEDRDLQLAFEKKIRSEEQQRKKDEEANLVEKIINEMEAEQRKAEKKKAQHRSAMKKVFNENMEDMKNREKAHRDQQEREAEAMKEYNRILDEQEEQRNEELQARMDRQKALMEKLQATAEGQAKDAGDNDAKRANAQQAEMDRHYFEAEQMKMKRLKQMKLENQAYLLRQMGEKDGRKDEEKMLGCIQSQILERDTEEYNQIERQKAVDKRITNFENRRELERQIIAKAGVHAPEMSDTEIALNKPLLALVSRTLAARDKSYKDMDMDSPERSY